MKIKTTLLLVLLALTAGAEVTPFGRYQTIIDRQMFGPLPPDFNPDKLPSEVAKTSAATAKELSQEQEQIKKAIRFSVLNRTPDGEVMVGFSDNADPKNPLHYYLKVGESQNGWTVSDADVDTASMTIVNREGITVTLTLGSDSATDAAAVSRAGGAQPPDSTGASGRPTLFGRAQSLRARRQQQQEQMAADAAKRAEEDRQRAAREEEESARRAAEREEQRSQLLQIQEELRKQREANEARKAAEVAELPPDTIESEV